MKVRMAVEQPNKDAFIEQVMRKYHFSTEEKEALQQVYEKVRIYMAPYAIYRINTRMRGACGDDTWRRCGPSAGIL